MSRTVLTQIRKVFMSDFLAPTGKYLLQVDKGVIPRSTLREGDEGSDRHFLGLIFGFFSL